MSSGNRTLRSFLPALYPVAALLTIMPMAELIGVAGQARPAVAAWRFGVMGLGFNALLVQTLGLATALAVAAALGHRRTLRIVSVASLVGAALVVAGIARFLIDFGEVQLVVEASERAALDAAALRALLGATLVVPVLVVLGGRGWTAAEAGAREPERPPAAAPRVIPFPGRTRAPDPRWPR